MHNVRSMLARNHFQGPSLREFLILELCVVGGEDRDTFPFVDR